MSSDEIPLFDDLSLIEKLNRRATAGVFGSADNVGIINHLTPDHANIRSGNFSNLISSLY